MKNNIMNDKINELINQLKINNLSNYIFINDSGNIQFNTLYVNLKEIKILSLIAENNIVHNIHISAYTKNSITVTLILKNNGK